MTTHFSFSEDWSVTMDSHTHFFVHLKYNSLTLNGRKHVSNRSFCEESNNTFCAQYSFSASIFDLYAAWSHNSTMVL